MISSLPQRAPRVQLDAATPAVLRFQDGQRTSGTLHVVSLTGGLLSLSNPLLRGSKVKLMFLTRSGSVLGGAEMLSPLSTDLQPFRFVALDSAAQCRLGATIQSALQQDREEQWIEKFRAAGVDRQPKRKHLVGRIVGALGLATLAWASVTYLLKFPLLK